MNETFEIVRELEVGRVEAAQRLQPASAIYFSMDEGDVRNIMAFEETMIGSDGLPGGGDCRDVTSRHGIF